MSLVEGAPSSFALRAHTPDVLSCIANLSNDVVFTPPALANRMLDAIAEAWAEAHDGASIWEDSAVTFLDPFTKSGVFLREIARRLTDGLAEQIPDLHERVDHILTKQVFGIAVTQLTALLARRSLYCSKDATGEHSIASSFDRDWGNVWFERIEHTWAGDRCAHCRAVRSEYARGDDLESHAYALIHTTDPRARLAGMFGDDVQFDVIIGNPPYQLSDEGSARTESRTSSASAIYPKFIDQAKRLEPRFLSMVIPSRWMAGGRGLDAFRRTMLDDRSLSVLVDYPAATDVFGPGVRVSGGVCYFLREEGRSGKTTVTTIRGQQVQGPMVRALDEYDVFVRDADALSIVHKVLGAGLSSVESLFVSGFGLDTNFRDFHMARRDGDLTLHLNVGGMGHKRAERHVARAAITRGLPLVDAWKVLVPSAAGYGAEQLFDRVLGKPILAGPSHVGTQTYRVVGPFADEAAARSFISFYSTRLFRFLVSLRKVTQHASPSVYRWVPALPWDRVWTDAEVEARFALSHDEVQYVASRVRDVDWWQHDDA